MKNTKNYKERQIIIKRIFALFTATIFIFMLAGCTASDTGSQSATQAQQTTKAEASANASEAAADTTAAKNDSGNSGKTLVVYFSATGNTKGIAEQIAGVTGADTYEIKAAQPYTSEDLNYNDSNSRSTKEQNDKTARPEIGSEKIDLAGYDKIYIGFPIWWGEEPRIMDTFAESYDFSGKTMIPFCTSGGSGIDNAAESLKTTAGSGDWKEGKRFSADASESEIKDWINTL